MGDYYDAVRRRRNLETAAAYVCSRGRSSRSKEIRTEVNDFDRRWTSRIQGLERALRDGRFVFAPQRAIFIPRSGKKPRPIIIAPLPNRILQRAILQVLRDVPKISEVLAVPSSVGGIEGVDAGIALVQAAIKNRATWYVRSDIPNFFGSIPRAPIIDFVHAATGDDELTELFLRATETTLIEPEKFSEQEIDLLPDEETGIAQGSALSTLIGNILLQDFDRRMQGNGMACIRYIDDFIILAKSKAQVLGAFNSAQRLLAKHGIRAYEHNDGSGKAVLAPVASGIDFLGCRIDGALVGPSQRARTDLLESIRQILADGRHAIRAAAAGKKPGLKGRRESQTLHQVDLVVNGWGQAFAFCNAGTVKKDLDNKIIELVCDFREENARLANTLPTNERGRVIGVTRLCDIPKKELKLSPRAHRSNALADIDDSKSTGKR